MIWKFDSADACTPFAHCLPSLPSRNQGFGTGLGHQFAWLVWPSLFGVRYLCWLCWLCWCSILLQIAKWETETLPTSFDLCFLQAHVYHVYHVYFVFIFCQMLRTFDFDVLVNLEVPPRPPARRCTPFGAELSCPKLLPQTIYSNL